MTRYESNKLQTEMRQELEAPAYAIWKCAAGLLFVTALVLSGVNAVGSPDAGSYATAQVSSHR